MKVNAGLMKVREKLFLGNCQTYPLLGIPEGGIYKTLKEKIDPGYLKKCWCPL